ncbi:ribose-5-phosphate isomerase [soil metagenome]
MTIYLGTDHRGFKLKQRVLDMLVEKNFQVVDCGNTILDLKDDYPDFAFAVAEKVAVDPESKGIILCGSGVGASIAANKIKGIRCAIGFNAEQVKAGRNDDDMNVLTIAANYTDERLAQELVTTFLNTPFASAERYVTRINKITQKEA